LAKASNEMLEGNNHFVNVFHYGENRGASYARNTGYNYSTADWVLFLDDDVVPDASILDAYAGSIARYPKAKCMVGLTKLPPPCNSWTKMLRTCNVMYFYGISKHRINPPWGVTANLMVKGSRHNHTVQFKHLYPKTGGGEDIDFVFQLKEFYKTNGCVVAVPEAVVHHPWWNKGRTCYGQIYGWANGDSQVLTEWPEKTFLVFPNWIESIFLVVFAYGGVWWKGTTPSAILSLVEACGSIAAIDHLVKVATYYGSTKGLVESEKKNRVVSWAHRIFLALGASTVISAQEITRALCVVKRGSFFSFARRMDWFDGHAAMEVLGQKLLSGLQFVLYGSIAWYFLQTSVLSSQCEVP
jgi:glycosyltransferase involved in cell wall biosynthesis